MSARRWTPPVLWAALILVLTSIPNPDVGGVGFPGADKLVHAALYLVLGWLAARAALADAPRPRMAWVVVAIALFAAVDELHQLVIAGRSPEVLDWIADMVGAALGVVAAYVFHSSREPAT